jgi:threonine/homoserine/homoserine lactone efflux protein
MPVGELVAFLGVSALVIVTPGQDTALTIRNTLLGGRVAGVCTAVGVSAGQATWTVATSVGIGAVLVASEPAFVALKLVGSVYLVFLGVQVLFGRKALPVAAGGGRVTSRAALRQGVLSNLANPKMLAFLHEPAAAVRELVRGAPGAGPDLLRDDAGLADGVQLRGQEGGRAAAPHACPSHD